MKLILAIVNNDDSARAAAALTKEGYFVTKLSTTAGFLMVGNTTLLIGTEDEKAKNVLQVLSQHCSTRTQITPSTFSFGKGLRDNSVEQSVTVGGATVFVLSVDSFTKL
ncbi:MAG TPA: transcriptional regulator [Clostridiales bacterium]|nr:transcriptional regulator [Clostridiales bacterium]